MSTLIGVLFLFLGIVFFVGIIGLPIWIAIYLIKEYRKNKKLSFFQVILFILLIIVAVNIITPSSQIILKKIDNDYGLENNIRIQAPSNSDNNINIPAPR